jgi:hypothetical protein
MQSPNLHDESLTNWSEFSRISGNPSFVTSYINVQNCHPRRLLLLLAVGGAQFFLCGILGFFTNSEILTGYINTTCLFPLRAFPSVTRFTHFLGLRGNLKDCEIPLSLETVVDQVRPRGYIAVGLRDYAQF